MDIKAIIKERALERGMDMFGVASVDRFHESPPGRHPTDILPGCKSVVVIGVRLLDGIVQANFRSFEDGRTDLKGLYGTYGYAMLPNFELTYACYAVAQSIERMTGAVATPISTGPMTNGFQLSIRHCAVAAGLGAFGWMGIVLTPEFGPRNRFGVILTTAELEPDPMYDGAPLCNPEKCGICTKACPTGAISKYDSGDSLTSTLGEKTYTYSNIRVPRCQLAIQAMRRETGGTEDWVASADPTPAEIAEGYAKMPIMDRGLQHVESHHCGKCLSYCPAGKWKEHFGSLSGGLSAVK